MQTEMAALRQQVQEESTARQLLEAELAQARDGFTAAAAQDIRIATLEGKS